MVRDPVLLHHDALHADLRSGRRNLACVIGLQTADRHERIGARSNRIGHDVFELPELVAAQREPGIAIVALGVDLYFSAERCRQPRQMLDGRRTEGQRIAIELLHEGHCTSSRMAAPGAMMGKSSRDVLSISRSILSLCFVAGYLLNFSSHRVHGYGRFFHTWAGPHRPENPPRAPGRRAAAKCRTGCARERQPCNVSSAYP